MNIFASFVLGLCRAFCRGVSFYINWLRSTKWIRKRSPLKTLHRIIRRSCHVAIAILFTCNIQFYPSGPTRLTKSQNRCTSHATWHLSSAMCCLVDIALRTRCLHITQSITWRKPCQRASDPQVPVLRNRNARARKPGQIAYSAYVKFPGTDPRSACETRGNVLQHVYCTWSRFMR